jgi:hypothetical protein
MKEIVGVIVENEKVAERIYLLKIRLPKYTWTICNSTNRRRL